MTYTDRVDGFQIRDVTYLGLPPKDTPPTFDIVKWVQCEPYQARDFRTGERKTYTEYCYSVGSLVWDKHDGGFDFRSVGLRWLESLPNKDVVDMVLRFAHEKSKELLREDD